VQRERGQPDFDRPQPYPGQRDGTEQDAQLGAGERRAAFGGVAGAGVRFGRSHQWRAQEHAGARHAQGAEQSDGEPR